MGEIIDGKKLAEKIKDQVFREIVKLNQGKKIMDKRPNLAIILVGKREDSGLYVNLKEKEARKVGIDTHIYKCAANTPEHEIFKMIDCLNKDDLIDAILVQLPLPKDFDTDGIILAIDPKKDVDRFHPDNLEVFLKTRDHTHVIPPLFAVVLKMLESIEFELANKTVTVVANADIFTSALAKVLKCEKMKTITAGPDDKDLKEKTLEADVLVVAVGRPGFITADMIKKDAVVIDIGINKIKDKIVGDVDFNKCKKKASFITPVPGGVGPMTIALLFKNTVELYKERHQ